MRILAIAASLMLLPGCYSLARYGTAEKVAAASTVEHDEYEGTTWVEAPAVWYDAWLNKCFLRNLTMGGRTRTNQLYVMYERSHWAFLDRAADSEGRTLKTLVIDRSAFGYTIFEDVAVELTDEYLENAARDGLDIQLSGKAGSTVVKLPAHYVRGFLDRVEEISHGTDALASAAP